MAHRGDVVGRVHQRQQGEDAVEGALVLLGEAAGQQTVLVEPAGFEQVVVQSEPVEGPAGLGENQLFDRGRRHGQVGLVAAQLLDRRQRLVAQEPVGILQPPSSASSDAWQGIRASVAGMWRRTREILLPVLHEVDQRRHDLFAVAGQDLARGALQEAVAEQRDQRRDEQEVAGAEPGRRCGWRRGRRRRRCRTSAVRARAGTPGWSPRPSAGPPRRGCGPACSRVVNPACGRLPRRGRGRPPSVCSTSAEAAVTTRAGSAWLR